MVHLPPLPQGPGLARPGRRRSLGIPYVIAEASHAPKQAGGRFDLGHRAAAQAIARADAVISLTTVDTEGLRPLLASPDRRRCSAPSSSTAPCDRGADRAALAHPSA